MNISLIQSTFKRPNILSHTLESFCELNTNGITWELIIVDNAGDPATQNVIREYKNRLPIKFLIETEPGKNNALNRAIPETKGELFVFTDDDVIADPNWLIEMWKGANRWPDHFVFGGRILPAWPEDGRSLEVAACSQKLLSIAYAVADWQQNEGTIDAGKVFGPNMSVKRELIKQGYAFNNKYGPTATNKRYIMGSETEFVGRLEKDGYKAIYLPRAVVYHKIRSEQLSKDWLYERAIRSGRSSFYHGEVYNGPRLLKAPRYLYRCLGHSVLKIFWYRLMNRKPQQLSAYFEYLCIKGLIKEHQISMQKASEKKRKNAV